MNTDQMKIMFLSVAHEMKNHTQELCRLDSYIGDGDHGITIERGFSAVENVITNQSFEKPAELLKCIGDTIMNTTGGAIGPILGTFFSGGCKKLADVLEMDIEAFGIMLNTGLKKIKMIGEANEGDRTLVDALSPACAAFNSAKDEGNDLKMCMLCAAEAAEKGVESTRNMIAKKGRAKFLGEKSIGYVDAGATSMSIIIRSISNYIVQM